MNSGSRFFSVNYSFLNPRIAISNSFFYVSILLRTKPNGVLIFILINIENSLIDPKGLNLLFFLKLRDCDRDRSGILCGCFSGGKIQRIARPSCKTNLEMNWGIVQLGTPKKIRLKKTDLDYFIYSIEQNSGKKAEWFRFLLGN